MVQLILKMSPPLATFSLIFLAGILWDRVEYGETYLGNISVELQVTTVSKILESRSKNEVYAG